MKNIRAHLIAEIFVIATGFAALVHSTWSAGTLFSGMQPVAATGEAWFTYALRYMEWMLPALLVAFALDIGQIATSHEIRECIKRGEQPYRKYVTFIVFALATYYLQWLYMAFHIPMLALGAGVSSVHTAIATSLRDLSIWIVPAFLPLSTLLYTFSHARSEDEVHQGVHIEAEVHVHNASSTYVGLQDGEIVESKTPLVIQPRVSTEGSYTGETEGAVIQSTSGEWEWSCPYCAMHKGGYAKEGAARNACSSHIGRWCKVRNPNRVIKFEEIASNE